MEDQGIAKSEKGGQPLSISFPSVHVTPIPLVGWPILLALRQAGEQMPVSVLTARNTVNDQVKIGSIKQGVTKKLPQLLVPGSIPWSSIYPCAFTKMCPDTACKT